MTDLTKLRADWRSGKRNRLRQYEVTALLDALDAAERERDEARAKALEEAAARCEAAFEAEVIGSGAALYCAKAIRALKDRAP